ncbi:erythromycin esterase family protein [Bacillus sp. T33-2]|uniref:erythromycin esterase family protein n=1 Tax=Bacillus sp. T33-2 TaxID=2054168 RepID=UPI0015E11E2A|nr:erythromycin esterase family protein [Bacillus sp. T33-2]
MLIQDRTITKIKEQAIRLETSEDLDAIVAAVGGAKYVLLGEASHGTSEFYTLRAELSKRLIEEKGFSFIAVEGDWPSCFAVNRFVKGYDNTTAKEALQQFNRWPTWMWANEEIAEFTEWIASHNKKTGRRTGFYGIDVYSLWESMEQMVKQLEKISPEDVEAAKKAIDCFEPFHRRPENYGISASFYGEDCTEQIVNLLVKTRQNRHEYTDAEEAALNVEVNSLVMLNAERYYRAMVLGGPDDWNIRDHHMVDALEKIMAHHGSGAKAIVWEHNTHVGDARATDMREQGLVNVGQLLREKHNEKEVYAVGFGTHHGSVIAARKWGERIEKMTVPAAEAGSWEDLMHKSGPFNKILFFTDENRRDFEAVYGHRAIGVVYNPEIEHLGNYVPSRMSNRYDAFIYVEETNALTPLTLTKLPEFVDV